MGTSGQDVDQRERLLNGRRGSIIKFRAKLVNLEKTTDQVKLWGED